MPVEVRCSSKKHAEIHGEVLEVACSSKYCGAERGVTVLHRFSLEDGRMLGTRRFRDPSRQRRD